MKRPRNVLAGLALAGLLAAPAAAQTPDPAAFLDTVQSYLAIVDQMTRLTSDPRTALLMAQNSIKEVYERKGQKAAAIPELQKLLEGLDDPAVRTSVRFTLADLYKETGQPDQALEQLRAVVAENKALLAHPRVK